MDPVVRTWNPPCLAWIETRVGIKRTVTVLSIVGQYATVSYFGRGAKRHPVRVSDLRKPEERYGPNVAFTGGKAVPSNGVVGGAS